MRHQRHSQAHAAVCRYVLRHVRVMQQSVLRSMQHDQSQCLNTSKCSLALQPLDGTSALWLQTTDDGFLQYLMGNYLEE